MEQNFTHMRPNLHQTLHVLNDLIRIQFDRTTGYEKASGEQGDPESRNVFYNLSIESRSCINNLHAEVIRLGGSPVTHKTITGKIYLYWLNGNNSFEGTEMPHRIANCMAAELAIQKAYQLALDQPLPADIFRLIEYQLWGLERAHQSLSEHHHHLTEQYDQQHGPTGS
jgi:uncharacterized protein (TIGR02284 family)